MKGERRGSVVEMKELLRIIQKYHAVDDDLDDHILNISKPQRLLIEAKQINRLRDISRRLSSLSQSFDYHAQNYHTHKENRFNEEHNKAEVEENYRQMLGVVEES